MARTPADDAEIAARAAHVEGDHVGLAALVVDVHRCDDPARRPGQEHVDRLRDRLLDAADAAVRPHDLQLAAEAGGPEPRLEVEQVRGDGRREVSAERGGAPALVVADLGRDVRRRDDVHLRQAPLDRVPEPLLVLRVAEREEQADAHRLDLELLDASDEPVDLAVGQRLDRVTVPVDALARLQDPLAAQDVLRHARVQVVHVLPEHPAHDERVPEARGRDERRPGARLLEQCVRRDGRSVDEAARLAEQRLQRPSVSRGRLHERVHHSLRFVSGDRERLERRDGVADEHDVRERAADVDADQVADSVGLHPNTLRRPVRHAARVESKIARGAPERARSGRCGARALVRSCRGCSWPT